MEPPRSGRTAYHNCIILSLTDAVTSYTDLINKYNWQQINDISVSVTNRVAVNFRLLNGRHTHSSTVQLEALPAASIELSGIANLLVACDCLNRAPE